MSDNSSEASKTLSNLSLSPFTHFTQAFPQELIHDILFRLPIKSLIIFTSVSKTWNSFIKNPTFILTHLKASTFNKTHNANSLILLHTVFGRRISDLFGRTHVSGFKEDKFSLRYDDPGFEEFTKIELPVGLKPIVMNDCFRVVGVCNGLVCLANDMMVYAYDFVLWNPCVRKYVTLPKPCVRFCSHGGYEAAIGFGDDDLSDDYKVVRVVTLVDEDRRLWMCPTIAQVYSLAKGCWSRVRSDLPPCQMHRCSAQAFVNGAIHWLVLRRADGGGFGHIVLTFDVRMELFGEMRLPKNFPFDESLDLRLSVSADKRSLALFAGYKSVADSYLDIWLMKKYGVEKSWTKLMILTPQGPERCLSKALCFRKNGEVVLTREDYPELLSVDMVSKQFTSLGVECGQLCEAFSSEKSLVLLDNKNAASY